MSSERNILVVEDESSISDTIAYALKSEGFFPRVCSSAEAALRAVKEQPPTLIVLDVGLPDMSGFDLCREIRKTSQIPIIFLTARAEEVDRILGLELGGDDYITKPFSPREFVARVRALLRRISTEPQAASCDASNFTIDQDKLRIFFKGKLLDLPRYEFRLLAILVRRPGRVWTREELMNRAWESPEMSLERTIDTHIKTIRAKLREIDPNDSSIETHRGVGYSLKES